MVTTYNHGVASCDRPSSNSYRKGCRCEECRRLNSLRAKTYRQQVLRGENDAIVDAGPSKERLAKLLTLGYTEQELERFGISSPSRIVHQARTVRKSTERAIMAVSGRKLTRGQMVEPSAARFLVRRWLDAGLSSAEISRATGLCAGTVSDLKRCKGKKVRAVTLSKLLAAKPRVDEIAMERMEDDGRKEGT